MATKTEKTAREADLARKIVLLSKANPYREETFAHDAFEKMRKRPTIRAYLAKWDEADRKTARRVLWNFCVRDGTAELKG